MDPLTNPALILFAAISPMLIAFIKQQAFPQWGNALIAFGCYIVIGVVGAFLSGVQFTPDNLIAWVGVVTTIGTVAYNLLWINLGEPTLTAATSFARTDGVLE